MKTSSTSLPSTPHWDKKNREIFWTWREASTLFPPWTATRSGSMPSWDVVDDNYFWYISKYISLQCIHLQMAFLTPYALGRLLKVIFLTNATDAIYYVPECPSWSMQFLFSDLSESTPCHESSPGRVLCQWTAPEWVLPSLPCPLYPHNCCSCPAFSREI